MASVQENIDRLTAAWLGEGRALPVLCPMETAERIQFAERHGISKLELLEAFRVIVERQERIAMNSLRSVDLGSAN
jgi:hypothetical protein